MGLYSIRYWWPYYAAGRLGGPVFVFVAFIGLVFVVAGVAILIFRPSICTFDRATGELTVLRRTIVSQKKERYPLSDIGAVVLETDKRDREYGPSYSVQLLMHSHNSDALRKGNRRLQMSQGSYESQQKNAEMVAGFLGVPFREEIRR